MVDVGRASRAVVMAILAVACQSASAGILSVPPVATSCVGDCRGDGAVTIGELIVGVGMAVNSEDAEACPDLDRNLDDEIQIDELVTAMANATMGCPPPDACGDGEIGPTEGCDDGNLLDGDGCSSGCELELIGVVDQSWQGVEGVCGTSSGQTRIYNLERFGQEFVPQQSPLVGVSVDLVATASSGVPVVADLVLRVREESITGPVIAAGRHFVDRMGGEDFTAEVAFDPPVDVSPGAVYVIEIDARPSQISWRSLRGRGDACTVPQYEPGRPITLSETKEDPAEDYLFETWTSEAVQ